jgi:hypothetical protein
MQICVFAFFLLLQTSLVYAIGAVVKTYTPIISGGSYTVYDDSFIVEQDEVVLKDNRMWTCESSEDCTGVTP